MYIQGLDQDTYKPFVKNFVVWANNERKEAFDLLFEILSNSQNPLPVIDHACSLIAKEFGRTQQMKIRQLIIESTENLAKQKQLHKRRSFVRLVSYILKLKTLNSKVVSSLTYTNVISILEDAPCNLQEFILDSVITNLVKVVSGNQIQLDKLSTSLQFIK